MHLTGVSAIEKICKYTIVCIVKKQVLRWTVLIDYFSRLTVANKYINKRNNEEKGAKTKTNLRLNVFCLLAPTTRERSSNSSRFSGTRKSGLVTFYDVKVNLLILQLGAEKNVFLEFVQVHSTEDFPDDVKE